MIVVREDEIGLRRQRDLDEAFGNFSEAGDFRGADIADAVVIGLERDADGDGRRLVLDRAIRTGHEPLPLARDGLRVAIGHQFRQADEQLLAERLDARFFQFHLLRLQMADGVNELEAGDGFGFANLFRRPAELRLEGAGKGFMALIAGVQRDA